MPARKAVIVGIEKYPVRRLAGPFNDIAAWTGLLQSPPFSFTVTPLPDANKQAIITAFTNLLRGAGVGDRLVFVFAGHGTRRIVNGSPMDGLVTPFSGASPGDDNIVFDSDLGNVMSQQQLSATGAELTLILDCCNAEVTGLPLQALAAARARGPKSAGGDQVRFIPAAGSESARVAKVDAGNTNAAKPFFRSVLAAQSSEPLVLAASDRDGPAFEGLVDHVERGLYSAAMIEAVKARPSISYRDLNSQVFAIVHARNPGPPGQQPQIDGPRQGQSFLVAQVPVAHVPVAQVPVAHVQPNSLVQRDPVSQGANTMNEFVVEFSGLCCHYKVDESNRLVILVDGTFATRHYPHIEVQEGGVVDPAGLNLLRVSGNDTYTRNGVSYQAYSLDRHRVSVDSVDKQLNVQQGFEGQVPHLTDVCPTFGAARIAEFAKPAPSILTPVAAQFPYSAGIVKVSQATSAETSFFPVENDPRTSPGSPRTLATGVTLTLQINGDPVLNITKFGTTTPQQFKLKSTVRRIRIGNLGLDGMQGLDELDGNHFLLYYKMADRPDSMPVPLDPEFQGNADVSKGLGGGCSNTQYP
jgi:hypothetical protein